MDFDSSEFISVVDELMADAVDAVVQHVASSNYDPGTLKLVSSAETPTNCKLLFISPSESNLTDYEVEDKDLIYSVKKWAIISYRGQLHKTDSIVANGETWDIRGFTKINPLGPTLYYRVKLYQ